MFLWVWLFLGFLASALSYQTFLGRLDEIVAGFAATVLWLVLALGATNLEVSLGGGIVYTAAHEPVVYICVGFAIISLLGALLDTRRFVKQAVDMRDRP